MSYSQSYTPFTHGVIPELTIRISGLRQTTKGKNIIPPLPLGSWVGRGTDRKATFHSEIERTRLPTSCPTCPSRDCSWSDCLLTTPAIPSPWVPHSWTSRGTLLTQETSLTQSQSPATIPEVSSSILTSVLLVSPFGILPHLHTLWCYAVSLPTPNPPL